MSTATLSPITTQQPAAAILPPQPVPFVYCHHIPPVPTLATEVLTAYVKARGKVALAEHMALFPILRDRAQQEIKKTIATRKAGENLLVAIDACQRYEAYESRTVLIGKQLGEKQLKIPPVPKIPVGLLELLYSDGSGTNSRNFTANELAKAKKDLARAEREFGVAVAVFSDPAAMARFATIQTTVESVNRAARPHLGALRRLLDELGSRRSLRPQPDPELWEVVGGIGKNTPGSLLQDLQGTLNLISGGGSNVWPVDDALQRAQHRFEDCQAIRAQIARLEPSTENDREVQGRAVQKAGERAGGDNQVVTDLRESLISLDRWHESDRDYPTLTANRARLETIAGRLDSCAPGSTTRKNLESEQSALIGECKALEPAIEQRRLREIEALWESACRGDEDSRQAIEGIARNPASAFADGFAESISRAECDQAKVNALLEALQV